VTVKIAIGADHAGYLLKEHMKDLLQTGGHAVVDLGTHSEEPVDYPPICAAVAREVVSGRCERGIVLGGSGQGEQIAANKVRGIRASLCNDLYTAKLARMHNDANVLSMGARVVGGGLADEILMTWLSTGFEGGRHIPRIEAIAKIEIEEASAGGAGIPRHNEPGPERHGRRPRAEKEESAP
jgi:ribose 5-phosphate isomerase B